jgi:chromosome segregation ATPase
LVELSDFVLLTTATILLAITAVTGVRYYRLMHKARFEYEKARDIVEEIVRSFKRELRRDNEKLNSIGFEIEGNSARIEAATKRVEDFDKKLPQLDRQLATVSDVAQKTSDALTETGNRVIALAQEHESLKSRIAALQEQIQKLSTVPEVKIEPVIPIRRDKAMASLTDTEVAVLEMLAAEGAKTAPEIKARVQLSREHTARLMKKLYEEGYLERETGKIPFKYNVKKEMEKFLNKPTNPV